jgi:hypothetical protein
MGEIVQLLKKLRAHTINQSLANFLGIDSLSESIRDKAITRLAQNIPTRTHLRDLEIYFPEKKNRFLSGQFRQKKKREKRKESTIPHWARTRPGLGAVCRRGRLAALMPCRVCAMWGQECEHWPRPPCQLTPNQTTTPTNRSTAAFAIHQSISNYHC